MFDKDNIKVGIAPINWTNDDLPELGGDIPLDTCLSEMNKAGYQGCEVGNKFPRDAKLLANTLKPYNLEIASAWFSSFFSNPAKQAQSLDEFKIHAEFLHHMGAKVVVVAECEGCTQLSKVPILDQKPELDDEGWQHLVTGLELAGDIAKDFGLDLVYHYHMGTVVQFESEIDTLMRLTNPDKVSLLLDTGHLVFAGGDNVKLIRKYGSRIKHVHLKDIRQDIYNQTKIERLSFLDAVKAGVFTVPGDGMIEYKEIFEALKQINYQGWFLVEAEQDPNKANPYQYAKIGRDTIQTLAGV